MIFGRKRLKQLDNPSYRQFIWLRFRENKLALWSLRILGVLVLVAIFADFIANDKPLYCKFDQQYHFPVWEENLVEWGLRGPVSEHINKNWYEEDYEQVIWPIIPYAATTLDQKNMQFAHPFKKQRVKSWRFHHWLGTNQIGKDVAAGLIVGVRIALTIGIVAMSIASFIGILIGGIAGFFGDHLFRISIIRLILYLICLFLALFWMTSHFYLYNSLFAFVLTLITFVLSILLANTLAAFFERRNVLAGEFSLPLDLIIMRVIEIINSMPGLLLLLAIIPLLEKKSIFNIMIIIGLIAWTGIARFIRAELLRIRSLEYIEAGRTIGFSSMRLLFRHALPNALGPVLVAISFGIASAILLEAYLSFLGFGLPVEEVTWGRQLNEARSATKAWWMAIFPGFAIFITVTMFNLLGEGISDALGISR